MLIRLTPDQVSEKWGVLGQTIMSTFEDDMTSAPSPTKLLEWLMEGRLHCWINSTGGKVDGVITTCFVPDTPFDTFSLLIFSLWASRKHGASEDWEKGFIQLREFAKQYNANSVLFFTKNPSVVEFARRQGAEEKMFFRVEVKNG